MIDSLYTVGEMAKRMGVSVRTLQYYDRQGLLVPSAHSEGGRRLYGAQDAIRLQQILSLKYLGLSLDDIKSQLAKSEGEPDVRAIVAQQISIMEAKVDRLQESIRTLRLVMDDIEGSDGVDFASVADALSTIRLVETRNWIELDRFDDGLRTHIERQSETDEQFKLRLACRFERVSNRMFDLAQANVDPTGPEGQAAAKEAWDMIQEFTGGDASLLSQLNAFNKEKGSWPEAMRERQQTIDDFMGRALDCYTRSLSIDLEGGIL
ncbi:MerR family transcriptional regulator [Raoultibacter phocaeensis]|uniref:MerR family transcriptional regulator n=1 Tax=Raoultibacter phocaeensis TaxID=2479841 RepID=UPI0015D5E7E1|nr:MerR family transcriptional regulator [Raoultibacter phocaeensis]